MSSVFNLLGEESPTMIRAKKFENEVLLKVEAHGLDASTINIWYDNDRLNISIEYGEKYPELMEELVSMLESYESGELFPPTKEELDDMFEVWRKMQQY